MRERELEGATILLVALLAPTSLYAAAQNPPPPVASVYWTETSVQDFRDGELDPMMFVSPRAQLDPDPGCVEFFARFDVDNNGYYDLVCADDSGPWLHLYFGSAAGYSPTNCRRYPVPGGGNIDLADLNLDGWAELIHSGWRSGHVTIYWGTDSGPSPSDTTWLQLSGQSEAVAVYDLDRDSYLDILAGSDNGNLYIFWGAASGYSSSRRSSVYLNGQIGHNLEVADFDRDGFGDIAASLWSRNRAAIIYWGAARTPREIVWLPVSPNNPHGITVADLNEDNWLDIVLTGYDTVTTAFIYYGSESGFSDTRRELIHPGQCYGGSAAVAWNSDKTLDLVFFRGDWGRTNTYRPRVFFNRLDTTPHFSDSRYSEIGELAFNASGGLAADLNYDGYLDLFVNNMLPDSASFVLWGPGFVNATPLPVDRDHHGVWREPGNIYTRGFNASYLSSVFDIGPDSVISSGTCSWTAREPAGAAVGIEVRSGRTPEPDSSWTDFYPITFNGGTLPATVTGRRFLQYRCRFSYTRPCNLPHLERISFELNRAAAVDVGVLAILAPTGTVDSGTVITPSAVVRNYQNSNPEIRVRLTIGSTYAATIVDTLLPSQTDTLFFPAWTATPPGLHPVRCSVYAHYDDNPANDTLSTTVRVRVRIDAAAVLILAPVGVVDSGTTTSPQALVANKGTRSGFFPVHMTIGLGYRESTTVMLAPDSSTTVSFPLWRADEVGTFRVCCSTALSDDVEPTNDTAIAFVAVANRHDASCHLILSPTGVLDSGSVVIPSAMVTNAGTCRELIPVVMRIGDAYLDTAYVSLAPGESLATYFNSWTASPTGLLTVRCSTALSEDRTPANDMATDSVFVTARPDAAVTDIYLPVGVVDSGTTIVPLARICNYGTSPAEVPVRMRIGESYDEVSYKFLGVGAKDTVQFPAWVASPPGVHAVVCSSAISGDVRPENDRRIDSVRVATTVDAGIVAILTPQGRVDSGTAVVPLAIVANYGTSPAFIPVRMQIGSDFDSMVFKMVRPGTEDTVEFPFWLASPVGTIPVRCSTAMPGDLFSGNDYLTSSVTVGVSVDAACLGIEIPDGTVDSGATVIPLVRVANYSTSRKEIPVLLRIGNDYLRGRRKQLDPGTSDTVSFPPWSAQPRGVVALTCSTALYGDERTKNDCVRKSVLVYSHLDAAVLDILVPVGGVDSGRQVTPKARIANYGTAPAVIPAEFRIGDFYRSGRSKLISPGVAETVHFDVWTAAELGRHTVRCTTLLDRDCDPANDTREAEVYVQWRDAGCIAILSPPGIVRAGDTVCPKARVRNFGMIPECIPVVFRYGSLYASLRHTDTLAPGDSAELEFPALIAESSAISASCSTALYYDMHAPNDKLTFTVFGAVRRVVIEPDTAASAPPGGIVNYFLTCRNEGNADDTIDITSQRTRTGWKVELLDSATLEPLADLNNNGLPDVSHLPVGGSSSLVCRLTLPAGEQGLVIDTTELVAASGADPRVTDMCRTSTTVQAFSGLVIEPDQFCLIPPGRPYDYIFTITNLGNVEDYADIAFFCTKGRWRHELLDRDGKSLGDRNANGRRDIGPLSPHSGTTELKLRLTPDSRAQVGERDTTSITIQSFADIGITDTACAVSEVSGAVSGLVVEPDQTTSVNVGATIGIPLWVETSGEIRAIINIAAVCSRPGWQLRLLDAAEKEELRDTDFDSLPDLGFVTPAIRTHFVLQVTAPGCEQLVANADSLPATVTVVASLSGEPTLCDTARVVVVPVPNFEVHNAANPFSERTRFIFSTPTRGRVSLLIYNRLGEIVRTLVKDADCESGIYSTEWDGTNDLGRRLAPGIYVYVFEVTPATGATRRLVRKAVLKR